MPARAQLTLGFEGSFEEAGNTAFGLNAVFGNTAADVRSTKGDGIWAGDNDFDQGRAQRLHCGGAARAE